MSNSKWKCLLRCTFMLLVLYWTDLLSSFIALNMACSCSFFSGVKTHSPKFSRRLHFLSSMVCHVQASRAYHLRENVQQWKALDERLLTLTDYKSNLGKSQKLSSIWSFQVTNRSEVKLKKSVWRNDLLDIKSTVFNGIYVWVFSSLIGEERITSSIHQICIHLLQMRRFVWLLLLYVTFTWLLLLLLMMFDGLVRLSVLFTLCSFWNSLICFLSSVAMFTLLIIRLLTGLINLDSSLFSMTRLESFSLLVNLCLEHTFFCAWILHDLRLLSFWPSLVLSKFFHFFCCELCTVRFSYPSIDTTLYSYLVFLALLGLLRPPSWYLNYPHLARQSGHRISPFPKLVVLLWGSRLSMSITIENLDLYSGCLLHSQFDSTFQAIFWAVICLLWCCLVLHTTDRISIHSAKRIGARVYPIFPTLATLPILLAKLTEVWRFFQVLSTSSNDNTSLISSDNPITYRIYSNQKRVTPKGAE